MFLRETLTQGLRDRVLQQQSEERERIQWQVKD